MRTTIAAIGYVVFSLALCLVPDGRTDPVPPPPSERRVTFYPGVCPGDHPWYLYDSTDSKVVVGCEDPDYQQPDPDPSDDSTDPSVNNALEASRRQTAR